MRALLRNGNSDIQHLVQAMEFNHLKKDRQIPRSIKIQMGGDRDRGCRFWGSIPLHKVAGSFHIMPGKAIPHPVGHAHMNFFGLDNGNFRLVKRQML